MNILIVDNGKIPAIKYGGTERVIWSLGKELTKMNHKITFLVSKGSYCNFAQVLEYNPNIDINIQIPDNIDIIHMHFEPKEKLKKPYVITMHGNALIDTFLDENTLFLSKNHAERHGGKYYVYNGLDWDDYPKIDLNKKRSYYHFLGRNDWKVKNLIGACKISSKANVQLEIMGGNRWTYPNIKRGFKYLLNPKIKFNSMVDNQEKIRIMQHSLGLLFPVIWHEPFGLAIIESLYAGTPVFATPYGSLPELVTNDVGAIGTDSSFFVNAFKNFDIKPKICHDYAVENFNSKIMALKYLEYYEKILNGYSINKSTLFFKKENHLLPFN